MSAETENNPSAPDSSSPIKENQPQTPENNDTNIKRRRILELFGLGGLGVFTGTFRNKLLSEEKEKTFRYKTVAEGRVYTPEGAPFLTEKVLLASEGYFVSKLVSNLIGKIEQKIRAISNFGNDLRSKDISRRRFLRRSVDNVVSIASIIPAISLSQAAIEELVAGNTPELGDKIKSVPPEVQSVYINNLMDIATSTVINRWVAPKTNFTKELISSQTWEIESSTNSQGIKDIEYRNPQSKTARDFNERYNDSVRIKVMPSGSKLSFARGRDLIKTDGRSIIGARHEKFAELLNEYKDQDIKGSMVISAAGWVTFCPPIDKVWLEPLPGKDVKRAIKGFEEEIEISAAYNNMDKLKLHTFDEFKRTLKVRIEDKYIMSYNEKFESLVVDKHGNIRVVDAKTLLQTQEPPDAILPSLAIVTPKNVNDETYNNDHLEHGNAIMIFDVLVTDPSTKAQKREQRMATFTSSFLSNLGTQYNLGLELIKISCGQEQNVSLVEDSFIMSFNDAGGSSGVISQDNERKYHSECEAFKYEPTNHTVSVYAVMTTPT